VGDLISTEVEMRRVTIFLVLLIVLSAIGIISHHFLRSPPSIAITVSQPRVLDMAPLYVALEKGYFNDEGIRLKLKDVGTPQEGIDDLVAGRSEIAFSGDTSLAMRIAQGAPVSILCAIDGSSHSIGFLTKKQGDPKQMLEGKRVGVRMWTSPHYFLDTYLLYHLIPQDRVELVEMNEGRLEQALLSGEVDAVAGFQADLARIRQKHPDFHVTYPEEIYRAIWVVAGSDRFVSAEPETVVRFLRALDQGVAFLRENESEAVAIVSRYTGVVQEKVREQFSVHHFEVSLDNSLVVLLGQEGFWGVEHGLLKPPLPDYRKRLYLKGIKAVRPVGITIID
jgi:ABC-type nitrate/sulfonate/bicarbonate transport system substrate-binding protein